MQRIIDFYNSPTGRKIVNWGLMAFGLLLQGGLIPLDTAVPILHVSLGTLLALVGARLPSVSSQGPSAVVPSVKGTA